MPPIMEPSANVASQVQVNVPLAMLMSGYLEQFLAHGLNPEIGLDATVLERYSPAELRPIADTLRRHGRRVTLHGPFVDLAPGSRDPLIREATQRRLDQLAAAAHVFRPLSVVCHAGYDWRRHAYFRDEWLAATASAWRWLAHRLADAGARLMLENVYERGPREALPLITELAGDGVKWCLDIGHAMAFGESPVAEWLAVLDSHIGQMHLHDNDGNADDHLELGAGAIDLDGVLRYLETRSTDRPVLTLEPHREADLAPSLDYLASHWPWPNINCAE